MQVNSPTNSSSPCATIDEVYGEQPVPCCDETHQAKPSETKEPECAQDYLDDLLIHILNTPT